MLDDVLNRLATPDTLPGSVIMESRDATRDMKLARPSSPGVSARMRRQRVRDTRPERALRRELHRLGLRFWVQRAVPPASRVRADIVFPAARVAVFVNGCFWHGCPEHATWPQSNAAFWRAKIEGNIERDARVDAVFEAAGWCSLRVWEHETVGLAAERVGDVVRQRKPARV